MGRRNRTKRAVDGKTYEVIQGHTERLKTVAKGIEANVALLEAVEEDVREHNSELTEALRTLREWGRTEGTERKEEDNALLVGVMHLRWVIVGLGTEVALKALHAQMDGSHLKTHNLKALFLDLSEDKQRELTDVLQIRWAPSIRNDVINQLEQKSMLPITTDKSRLVKALDHGLTRQGISAIPLGMVEEMLEKHNRVFEDIRYLDMLGDKDSLTDLNYEQLRGLFKASVDMIKGIRMEKPGVANPYA